MNWHASVRRPFLHGQAWCKRVVVPGEEVHTIVWTDAGHAQAGYDVDKDDMTDDYSAQNPRPNNMPIVRIPALLAFLQKKPNSLLRRRTLIVLLISFPLWLYAITWDIVMMLFDNLANGKSAGLTDILQLVMTRSLLLPLLVGAYLLAINISLQRNRALWFAASQMTIALVFSLLTPPVLAISYYLTNRSYANTHTLRQALALIGPWQEWLASTVQYSIVYVLGLVLILALNAFLRFKSEQLKTSQLHSKWLEARLGTLRGQLNPHFFFNALNTIVALIHTDPDRAEKLLTELSTLIRLSLADSRHEFTTVKDEMQFIERYLTVIKARYEDRLVVQVQLDPQVLNCSIPTFLLVPLVENAVKHGIAKFSGRDTLEIAGNRSNGYLQFTIKNVTSVSDERFEEITDSGVGLKNTRLRLSAIYGKQYRFESSHDLQGHWLASVAIPVHGETLTARMEST